MSLFVSVMKRWKRILQKRAEKAQAPQLLGKRSPYELIGVPVITEKTMYQAQEMNTYTFRVDS